MTNKTIALSREMAERIGVLLIRVNEQGPEYEGLIGALAEPVPPAGGAPVPEYFVAACDKFDWTPEEALRFYAEGKHFDVVDGRTRILCTGAIASHALKGIGGEYADMKGMEPAGGEPDFPEYRDLDVHPVADIEYQRDVGYNQALADTRPIVTRLQAEVEDLSSILGAEIAKCNSMERLAESRKAEVIRLRSVWTETNAKFLDFRDLLMDVACSDDWVISSELRKRILDTLSVFDTPGQAPADSYAAIRKERDDLLAELTEVKAEWRKEFREWTTAAAEDVELVKGLQSELTKARELLHRAHAADTAGRHELPYNVSRLMDDIEAFLQANQSAPADKGAPEDCAHSEANKHGCPECGEEFKP